MQAKVTAGGSPGLANEIFLVGARYGHHAEHSGYEGFRRYIGTQLKPLAKFRYLKFTFDPELGWRIDLAVARLTKRKFFAVGLLISELGAAAHMATHRRAVYHVLYGDTDVWMLGRVGRITGNYAVATFHEPAEILETLVDDRLAESLDGVVLVSESQRSFFERLISSDKIFVVKHGVDTEFFHPGERSPQPTCITVGGHLRDFKALQTAIDLVLSVRPDVHFVAIGTNGEKGEPPFRHARVEHLDGISDEALRSRYQAAWVGIYCFRQVTANNAVLETMSCGVPVVATDIGGMREYAGSAGAILCPPHNPEAIAKGVLETIEDENGAAARRSAARTHALQFDYRIAAEKMAKMYVQVAHAPQQKC
jgi:glycosyltransferase involved in cell wall biosynthesis